MIRYVLIVRFPVQPQESNFTSMSSSSYHAFFVESSPREKGVAYDIVFFSKVSF